MKKVLSDPERVTELAMRLINAIERMIVCPVDTGVHLFGQTVEFNALFVMVITINLVSQAAARRRAKKQKDLNEP